MAGLPSPQFALLNYFFPGYSFIISSLNTSLGGDFERYLPIILLILGATVFWNYTSGTLPWIESYFMASFTVRADDETYNILMLWTTRQNFSTNTRNFIVNTDVYSRFSYMWREDDDDDGNDNDDGEDMDKLLDSASSKKHILHYTPSSGSHWFWYKGRLLRFDRRDKSSQDSMRSMSGNEEISVSCFGRDPSILKELLRDARSLYLKKDDRKTIIYRATTSTSSYSSDAYWQRCMSRPNRPFSTVILPEKVKSELIADAADYLDRSTRRWYANRGIPYRRGYLLYGPPGTGKSSLSLALAGYFRMKIYIVSLSSVSSTEEKLASLFNELPTNCVVLLEDIDSAGLTHTRDPASDEEGEAQSSDSSGQLSLSGLLNILDGVAAKEGRVLIMTTNHLEKLDKALIRPGRVDMIIQFGLADKEMAASIFCSIYNPYEDEVSHDALFGSKDDEALSAAAKAKKLVEHVTETKERINILADKFASKIPEQEFSPAEIQGLLLRHKHQPQAAIDNIESWIEQMRVDKKQKKEEEEAAAVKRKEKEAKEAAEAEAAKEAETKKEEETKEEEETEEEKTEEEESKEKEETEEEETTVAEEIAASDDTNKDEEVTEQAQSTKEVPKTTLSIEKKGKNTKIKGSEKASSDSGYETP